MPTRIGELVTISPAEWPDKELEVHPGDLTEWMQVGLGLVPPMLMRPWDDLGSVLSRGAHYGAQHREGDPILDAPRSGAAGGVVYFDGFPPVEQLASLMSLLQVHTRNRHYAVYVEESPDPNRENYLTQIRIVSRFALQYAFGALSSAEFDSFPEQRLEIGALTLQFVADQQKLYGPGYSDGLDGVLGGDGDWARETLAFGFAVENEYQGVYRIWSRAWVVTK